MLCGRGQTIFLLFQATLGGSVHHRGVITIIQPKLIQIMKRYFRLLMLLPVLALGFVACDKSDESTASDEALIEEIALSASRTEVGVGSIPADAVTYLEENLFETYVEEVYHTDNVGYEIRMGNGQTVFCNERGRVLEYIREYLGNGPLGPDHPNGPCFDRVRRFGRPVRPAALPQPILDYVAANYPDNQIRRAKFNGLSYFVLVNVPVVLQFSADGNYVGEVDVLEHCRFPCRPQTVEELPETISSYLATNFPEAENVRACRRPNLVLVTFVVGEGRVVLGFDEEGTLLFQRP